MSEMRIQLIRKLLTVDCIRYPTGEKVTVVHMCIL